MNEEINLWEQSSFLKIIYWCKSYNLSLISSEWVIIVSCQMSQWQFFRYIMAGTRYKCTFNRRRIFINSNENISGIHCTCILLFTFWLISYKSSINHAEVFGPRSICRCMLKMDVSLTSNVLMGEDFISWQNLCSIFLLLI